MFSWVKKLFIHKKNKMLKEVVNTTVNRIQSVDNKHLFEKYINQILRQEVRNIRSAISPSALTNTEERIIIDNITKELLKRKNLEQLICKVKI